MFAFTKIKITVSKTRTKLAATQYWRLPSSPLVEKICIFYVVVVAVVVVAVVAVDIVEDDVEDDVDDEG